MMALAATAAGCEATAEFQLPENGGPVTLPADALAGVSGARRLTRTEYDATLRDLLGDATNSGFALLPADSNDPFDNDYKTQIASAMLVEAVERLAIDAVRRALADPGKRDALVQCAPSGPGDAECLRRFVTDFGRKALRRPLSEEEVTGYLALQSYAVEANDFYVGVELVMRALLQQVEFLYRVELGTPVAGKAGTFRLSPFELATRMSYFLWGSTPPEWLLDLAQNDELRSTAHIRAAAQRLVDDPRATERVDRFHALWLGYHQLPHPVDLTNAMRAESGALVKRVVFDDRGDYLDLFRATETYATDALANHYGLPGAGGSTAQWVSYGASGRKGLLSHGSVLSAGAKFNDTSPTQRGIFVRTRLLCQEVPPPPPNVDVDQIPQSPTSNCKKDRYSAHASVGNCKSCHQNIDPVGFGLESYDRAGRYRTHDDNEPACLIDGQGVISELGGFNGPAGLSDLLVASGGLDRCVVTQVYRFAMGRREAPADAALVEKLTESFRQKNRPFAELLLDFVADETFAFRMEE